MPYQGTDSFWAYASIFPELFFVIVVPKKEVMGLPERIGEMFFNYAQGQTAISVTAVALAFILVTGLAFFASRMVAAIACEVSGAEMNPSVWAQSTAAS